jgi:thiosulfate dehydrogenase [quinone] large subunit
MVARVLWEDLVSVQIRVPRWGKLKIKIMYGLKAKLLVFLLRISMGWMFFYSGASKILSGHWSAYDYLTQATTFNGFFSWLAQSQNLTWVNFVNEWAQLLIGAALIIGIFVKPAAWGGIALLFLYYLPVLDFPMVSGEFYLVDMHVIYILVLMLLMRLRAGKHFGLSAISERFSS